MSRDEEIILDLAQACRLILAFTSDQDKAAFLVDVKTQSSVLAQIIILGEAVNRLSDTFKAEHSQIPFAQIKGMRNRVTHEYKEVDFELVWDAIEQNIPELLALLEPLLPVAEN